MSSQFGRRINLVVFTGEKGLDLSAFRIKFNVQDSDNDSPNNCNLRVYNLSEKEVDNIIGEFANVALNAGYEGPGGNYGLIFKGSIKQFRKGRESATDTYLDIFASDGDIGYNQGVINTAVAKGTTPLESLKLAAQSMPGLDLDASSLKIDKQHVPSIRGKVMFGMARAQIRNLVNTLDATWTIQDGKVVVTDRTGYRDGEIVKINVGTGMVGVPEQTDEGIKIRCLLNSRLRIGNLVQVDNAAINTLIQQNPNSAPVPYNQWSGFQFSASISADGVYRAFVVEHEGDTRGNEWYSSIVALDVNRSAPPDNSVSPL